MLVSKPVPVRNVCEPKSRKRYSAFADQLGLSHFSTPPPTARPTRLLVSEKADETTVGAPPAAPVAGLTIVPTPLVIVVVVVAASENFVPANANPAVPYNSQVGSTNTPARPRKVPNQGNFHWFAAVVVTVVVHMGATSQAPIPAGNPTVGADVVAL